MALRIITRQWRAAIILLLAGLVQGVVTLHAQSLSKDFEYAHRLKLMPVGFVIAYGRANTTIGCSYEYMFDRAHGIAFCLPFAYGYHGAEQQLYNDNKQLRASKFFLGTEHTSWHIAPGIQVHTGKGRSPVDFSTGLGVVLGELKAATRYKSPFYPYDAKSVDDDYGLLGLALDSSLDYAYGHVVASLSLRLGTLAEQHDFSSFFFAAGVHFGLRK